MADDDARERARALLAAHHEFPGPFEFRVVVRPVDRTAAVTAVVSAAGGGDVLLSLDERASARGSYVSLRITVRAASPEVVLDVYEGVRRVDGVLTVM